MQFAEFVKLKEAEEAAFKVTSDALDKLCGRLTEFLRGFQAECNGWAFNLERVDTKESLTKEHDGLQMDLMTRIKPHTEDPKKFAAVRVTILDTGKKTFIKGVVIPRGNPVVDETLRDRLVEYVQGELNVFNDVEVLQ